MIEVSVDPYCNECEEFEPRCFTSVGYNFDAGKETRQVRTTIECRHKERCRAIHEHAVDEARAILTQEGCDAE